MFPAFRFAFVAAAAMLAAASPAGAQPEPSADDIVNALKSHGDLSSAPTRGIRILAPNGPKTPARAAESPASAPSIDLSVQFASGSAELTPAATRVLNRLGQALTNPALASDRFRIEGHTDTVGTPDANKSLSQRRADRAAAYLEQKFGIDAGRLEAVGVGEEGLLVQTADQVAEPRNRRVHIVNLGS